MDVGKDYANVCRRIKGLSSNSNSLYKESEELNSLPRSYKYYCVTASAGVSAVPVALRVHHPPVGVGLATAPALCEMKSDDGHHADRGLDSEIG
ncbi:hypothetical protein IEQ34_008633 [Dendrobium chrysotoxum]|uniref:Uncharacterized protein n=1 Tax=Dendrobium chrysotoxum TaxID=161865 RepID=A0AAV7GZK9_DENCH|nr:hypothetical protein IEQ34_008633 [Dendrobium chrysotoxum]